MGIENSMEQDSNRNADSGPGMARVQKLEKRISVLAHPYSGLWGSYHTAYMGDGRKL